jgi:hypothetical protein
MRAVKKTRDKRVTARPAEPVTHARNGSWRSRIVEPVITDPKKAQRVIDRATSRIHTTARIDTITGE